MLFCRPDHRNTPTAGMHTHTHTSTPTDTIQRSVPRPAAAVAGPFQPSSRPSCWRRLWMKLLIRPLHLNNTQLHIPLDHQECSTYKSVCLQACSESSGTNHNARLLISQPGSALAFAVPGHCRTLGCSVGLGQSTHIHNWCYIYTWIVVQCTTMYYLWLDLYSTLSCACVLAATVHDTQLSSRSWIPILSTLLSTLTSLGQLADLELVTAQSHDRQHAWVYGQHTWMYHAHKVRISRSYRIRIRKHNTEFLRINLPLAPRLQHTHAYQLTCLTTTIPSYKSNLLQNSNNIISIELYT